VGPGQGARSAPCPGSAGLLEDELCPDEIEGWTAQDASRELFRYFGDDRVRGLPLGLGGELIKGLIVGAGGDIFSGKSNGNPWDRGNIE